MTQTSEPGITIIANPGVIVSARVVEMLRHQGLKVCVMDALGTRILKPEGAYSNKRLVVSEGFDYTLQQIQERWRAGRRYFRLQSSLGQIAIWPDTDQEYVFVVLYDQRAGSSTPWMILLTKNEANQLVLGVEADEETLFYQRVVDYFQTRDRADFRLCSLEQVEGALPWEQIKRLDSNRI